MTYQTHAIATIFPMMSAREFDELCEHITAYGLIEPIVIYEGKILDGRNRYDACRKTGTEPRFVEWCAPESISAVQWVIGKNMKRRHLTSEQKAVAAVLALPLLSEEAKKRQVASGGDRKSEEYQKSVPEKVQEPISPRESAEEAAALFGTNSKYVYEAAKIQRDDPGAFMKMQHGEMTFKEAREQRQEQIRNPPPERIDWKAEYWKLREQVDVVVTSLDPEELQQAIVRTEALLKAKALPR